MSLFKYIAILGRQPELSLMELEVVAGAEVVKPCGRSAALVAPELAIDRLGGILKLGEVLYRGPVASLQELPLDLDTLPLLASKTNVGISCYGTGDSPKALLAAGLELKKSLRGRDGGKHAVRLVVPATGTALSAAEIRHNRLLEGGFELLVVVNGGEMVIARTTAVQNIDWYSRRDYERPVRSAKVGMLPPKLAQMLVNSTTAEVVVDPFCGTGVVLQEARLLGRKAVGSDISAEMVAASTQNMQWLEGEVEPQLPAWRIDQADARTVQLPKPCAVVSEGYLGPNLTHSPTAKQLEGLQSELVGLYRECLRNWAAQLTRGSEVTLCVPAWRVVRQWQYLGLVDELAKLGYTLRSFRNASSPMLYARDDQVVGRQILLLRKI